MYTRKLLKCFLRCRVVGRNSYTGPHSSTPTWVQNRFFLSLQEYDSMGRGGPWNPVVLPTLLWVILWLHEFESCWLRRWLYSVSYKLALTKSMANKGISHLPLWRLNPAAMAVDLQGVQGGERHSVLQGIWWDSLLCSWMFLETDFMISILASPHF